MIHTTHTIQPGKDLLPTLTNYSITRDKTNDTPVRNDHDDSIEIYDDKEDQDANVDRDNEVSSENIEDNAVNDDNFKAANDETFDKEAMHVNVAFR